MATTMLQSINDAPFVIAGREFRSRLILGTGKYRDNETMVHAFEAADVEMVTVAVRRVNLDRRVETVFPIDDPSARARVKEILEMYLLDNVKARVLQPDGSYVRIEPGEEEPRVNIQDIFMRLAGSASPEGE